MKIRFDVLPNLDSYKVDYPVIPRIGEEICFDIWDKNRSMMGRVEKVNYYRDIVIVQIEEIDES